MEIFRCPLLLDILSSIAFRAPYKAGHSLHRQTVYFETREGKSDKNVWKKAKRLAMVGILSGLKSERKIRRTLKEASEKNNALRRLKPCFEGSIN
ncbi:hypothetical protein AVEN_51488-1 [Araneus ventricosus]|uniref:Uncharacterized protein n=1 Tax=Araneus ventricosus TaxID=182803 RepID=A0A4Y2V8C3_ARAVE|nr:hypothetical protein AVEN_51488-1 [Araneus ventricosus]